MSECQVVKDLLPLYVEDLVSEESAALVDKHVKTCGDCKQYYEQVKKDYESHGEKEQISGQYKQLMEKFIRYQKWLKLSFAFVLTFGAVVFSLMPVPLLSTFFLLTAAPVASVFLYKKIMPLLLVNFVSVAIAITIFSDTISEALFLGVIFIIFLSLSTFAGFGLWKGWHQRRLNSKGKNMTMIGLPSLLLAVLMFFNAGFTGNPVSYWISYIDISNYVKEQYKEEDLQIKGLYFSWYDSYFYAKVVNGTEEFRIDRYRTGAIGDYRQYEYTMNYGEHYTKMLQLALNQAARDEGRVSQYFWVTNVTDSEELQPFEEMELIIRFAKSDEQYPEMASMTKQEFVILSQFTVDTLGKLNLSYKTINFQAKNEGGEDMYLDSRSGIAEESIYTY